MNFKYRTIWLVLAVLLTITSRSWADQLSAVPQTDKTSAAQIQKDFNAFWTTEGTQPVKIAPTLANVHYGAHEKQVLDLLAGQVG